MGRRQLTRWRRFLCPNVRFPAIVDINEYDLTQHIYRIAGGAGYGCNRPPTGVTDAAYAQNLHAWILAVASGQRLRDPQYVRFAFVRGREAHGIVRQRVHSHSQRTARHLGLRAGFGARAHAGRSAASLGNGGMHSGEELPDRRTSSELGAQHRKPAIESSATRRSDKLRRHLHSGSGLHTSSRAHRSGGDCPNRNTRTAGRWILLRGVSVDRSRDR